MATTRLDPVQARILRAFRTVDPTGEYEINAWYLPLVKAVDTGEPFRWKRELESLVKRGLLAADGRGVERTYWLTPAGMEAEL